MLEGAAIEVIVIEVEFRWGLSTIDDQRIGNRGGARLRALREANGKTQLWVELEAELGTGYLQRVESGKVALPRRLMLERILAALGARYSERRQVLEEFGYTVSTPPPDDEEVAWARSFSRQELDQAPFPAYVLDCTHRLIAWNGHVPPLFGCRPGDSLLGWLADRSFLEAWFDPASPISRLVAEPDRFLPAMIRAFRSEMQLFHAEPWSIAVLDRLQSLPRFRHYWSIIEREDSPVSPARAIVPVRLNVPEAGALQFRLSAEHFVQDVRFRILYYFPADLVTMRWCASLASDRLADNCDG